MQKIFYLVMLWALSGCQSVPKELVAYKKETQLQPYAIMQGYTTDNMTLISVLAPKDDQLDFQVLNSSEKIHTYVSRVDVEAVRKDYVVHQLKYTRLSPQDSYTLQVLKSDRVVDQRTFKAIDLKQPEMRIGVVSCMNDHYMIEQFKMWSDYLTQSPDYTFLIGDNVYADYLLTKERHIKDKAKAHEAMLWRRYIETWNRLLLYRSSELTPTLAIWDDHDYGINDGDRNFPYKEKSLEVFRSFYPIPEDQNLKRLKGAGFIFETPHQRFVFLDARSFRSPEKRRAGEEETQWGKSQTEQVIKALNVAKPTWLIQGDQFFGAYHRFESFEGHRPQDFKKVLSLLKQSPSPIFFVSGDRHLTEMMKIEKDILGYETYEITSSAIHARVYPDSWKNQPNPRQIHGRSGIINYSLVENRWGEKWNAKVTAFGPEMQVLYEQEIELDKDRKTQRR